MDKGYFLMLNVRWILCLTWRLISLRATLANIVFHSFCCYSSVLVNCIFRWGAALEQFSRAKSIITLHFAINIDLKKHGILICLFQNLYCIRHLPLVVIIFSRLRFMPQLWVKRTKKRKKRSIVFGCDIYILFYLS